MKGLKNLSRVSWVPDANLCQVKLFLLEDCPSKVRLEAEHHQLKASWISHSNAADCDSHRTGHMNPLTDGLYVSPQKEKLSKIPQINWRCPPKFSLNYDWHVAAGEESKEAEAQKQREMKVLQPVYHLSAIPPSPSMSLDVEHHHIDDRHIPVIPITPIEEEAAAELPSDMTAPPNACGNSQALDLPQGSLTTAYLNRHQCNPPVSLKPPANEKPALGILPDFDGDLAVAAAAAALTAILKSKEQGSMIDTDLLIQFLSNPKMIEQLMDENAATANAGSKQVTPSVPLLISSKPDLVIKKSVNEYGEPANAGTVLISGLKTASPLVPLPCSKPEVEIKKLVNMHGPPASSPISWSPSIHLRSSKPSLINEHGAYSQIGTAHIAGSKPVTAFPGSKPDLELIKWLINEYGAPNNTGNETMPGSKLTAQSVLPFTPNSEMVELHRPNLHPTANVFQPSFRMRSLSPDTIHSSPFSATIAPPVKDLNYYKSLIKQHGEIPSEKIQHGERQETLNHYVSQFGKPYNHSRGPELEQNLKSSESKPKHQKPCMYYNSSKGCRKGSSCPFQHVKSNQLRPGGVPDAPGAKRMKLGGAITGKT